MTTRRSSLLFAAALCAAAGYGVHQDPERDAGADARAVQSHLTKIEQRLSAIETYLQAQADSMNAFGQAVDVAEQRGFAAGINPASREALIAAWRERVRAARRDVPGAAADRPEHAAPAEASGERRHR